jgi:hypothetical protein
MNQQRIHARSTQIKKVEDCKHETETALDIELKTHCVYPATVDARKIYTDQTGSFPMALYKYDGNAIMAEPIKNRTARELLRAFKVMDQKLIARGLTPCTIPCI